MKIALAQIDERMGCLDELKARIEGQARLAADQGAELVCVPAPLMCGVMPGGLVEYANFERDAVQMLVELARELEPCGIDCLIPAVLGVDGTSFVECYLLREGRVSPLRLTMLGRRDVRSASWAVPIIEVAGMRVAITFDFERDCPRLPSGCDVAVYFQVDSFNVADPRTHGAARVSETALRALAVRAGIWLACMAPVGAYDEAAYVGGSYVMDDRGRLVAHAPYSQQDLLVQEVVRGAAAPGVEASDPIHADPDMLLWEALRLFVRDSVRGRGLGRAALVLEDDAPHALLALLAVDALGPRNVDALIMVDECAETPAAQVALDVRLDALRAFARQLGLRAIECPVGDGRVDLARGLAAEGDVRMPAGAFAAICLARVARASRACPLAVHTKTDFALRASSVGLGVPGSIAPFGDVFASTVERLARQRADRLGPLAASVLDMGSADRIAGKVLDDVAASLPLDPDCVAPARRMLSAIDLATLDSVLAAHIEEDRGIEGLAFSGISPEALGLLLLTVRREEAARRGMPMAPIVSRRSFAERQWPVALAWADTEVRASESRRALDLAHEARRRLKEDGEARGAQARGEIVGLMASLLGISPDQLIAMASGSFDEDGAARMGLDLHESLGRMGERGPGDDPTPGFTFFSPN